MKVKVKRRWGDDERKQGRKGRRNKISYHYTIFPFSCLCVRAVAFARGRKHGE